jgi:hypothetical protein
MHPVMPLPRGGRGMKRGTSKEKKCEKKEE